MNIKGIITAKSLTINDYTLRLEPADGGVQISIIRGNEIQTEFIPDGLSPEFGVETVEGGHKLTVTDAAGTREYFLPDAALPEGGEPGQILTRTADNAEWADLATDDDVISLLLELDALPTLVDASGAILTDNNGVVLLG